MGYVLPEMLSAFLLEDTGLHMLVVAGEKGKSLGGSFMKFDPKFAKVLRNFIEIQ